MKAGIVGASGYTGGDLIRLLLIHPEVELTYITSRQYQDKFVKHFHPNLRGITDLKFDEFSIDKATKACDVIFLAVPHKAAMNIAPDILATGLKLVDLSADFRLKDIQEYEKYYCPHTHPELFEKAVYGLPELHREALKKAAIAAVPGCMASSAILGLAPIIKEDFIDTSHIIIDTKIGSSGGGKNFSFASHHPERTGVVRPYGAAGHRHLAEINQELSFVAGTPIKVGLSTHAVDMVRGILSTIHIFLNREVEDKDIWKPFRKQYNNEPFIRFVKQTTGNYRLPDPKGVIGSNFCDIGFVLDENIPRLVILSAIDNLIKGAAGSAVQSMNVMLGLEETAGLMIPALYPI
ncbi:MAG: N-acetyl-gamma-glutamyl-phosphate reductase [Promethearchaeota archaeon]|nr:MAG: N-acetyl-gamma-glutamyl-phosphate reductase [Candidatus Lokiarchaeota archaeon]